MLIAKAQNYVKYREVCYSCSSEGIERTTSMTQGTIKTMRDEKGFGFITPDGGTQDLFFHSNSVEGNTFAELREGQRVQFMAGTDPRNPRRSRAEHVRVILND